MLTGFKRYLRNILIWLDHGVNVVFLLGEPGETVSLVAARNQHTTVWRLVGRFLDWIDPGHLERALEDEKNTRN